MQIDNLDDLSVYLQHRIKARLAKLNRLGNFTEDKISIRLTKSGVIDLLKKYHATRVVKVVFVLSQGGTEKEYFFHHVEFDEVAGDNSR